MESADSIDVTRPIDQQTAPDHDSENWKVDPMRPAACERMFVFESHVPRKRHAITTPNILTLAGQRHRVHRSSVRRPSFRQCRYFVAVTLPEINRRPSQVNLITRLQLRATGISMDLLAQSIAA